MDERRYHQRYRLDSANICGEMPTADNVKILDISLSGVLVETDRRPDIGNRYILQLESDDSVLSVQGTVVRSAIIKSGKDPQGGIISTYAAGIHFTNFSQEKIIEIAKFIKKYILDDQKQEFKTAYLCKQDDR